MFFKSGEKTIGAVFDVGTASVSATLYERGSDGRPSVITTLRKFHKASLRGDEAHFSKSTVHLFSGLLKDIATFRKGTAMPRDYTIGLSSVFYLGKTSHVYQSSPEARKVSNTLLESIIDQEKQKFLADVARTDITVFEASPMKILLNGYTVADPVNKFAQEIELWAHFAATSRELADALTKEIHAVRNDARIRFMTFPIAAWSIMRDFLFPEHAALLVDIGGELTEVAFLVDGVIIEVLALPFGVLNVLMRISNAMRVDLENALSLLKGYTGGALEEKTNARIRDIIKQEMKNWEQNFERVWQRASHHMMSEINMFFLGGGALVADMKSAVAPPLLHPEMAHGLRVSIITPDAFRDKFEKYSSFEGPGDFGLVSLILQS